MQPFDTTLRFAAVIVVESLAEGSLRTGLRLVESVLRPASERTGGPLIAYCTPETAAEFFAALEHLANETERVGTRSLLHIEAHGDDSGLQLASGEVIGWEELRPQLTRINAASGLGLTVGLAACGGWYLTRTLLPMHAAPAFAILGPTQDVKAGDLFEAFEGFYYSLLLGSDGAAALRSLNAHLPQGTHHFAFEFAASMFCRSFRRYHEDHCAADVLALRENEIVAELVRRRGLNLLEASEARIKARAILADQSSFFDHAKDAFFMFERFPDNRKRFPLTFLDCSSAAPLEA